MRIPKRMPAWIGAMFDFIAEQEGKNGRIYQPVRNRIEKRWDAFVKARSDPAPPKAKRSTNGTKSKAKKSNPREVKTVSKRSDNAQHQHEDEFDDSVSLTEEEEEQEEEQEEQEEEQDEGQEQRQEEDATGGVASRNIILDGVQSLHSCDGNYHSQENPYQSRRRPSYAGTTTTPAAGQEIGSCHGSCHGTHESEGLPDDEDDEDVVRLEETVKQYIHRMSPDDKRALLAAYGSRRTPSSHYSSRSTSNADRFPSGGGGQRTIHNSLLPNRAGPLERARSVASADWRRVDVEADKLYNAFCMRARSYGIEQDDTIYQSVGGIYSLAKGAIAEHNEMINQSLE